MTDITAYGYTLRVGGIFSIHKHGGYNNNIDNDRWERFIMAETTAVWQHGDTRKLVINLGFVPCCMVDTTWYKFYIGRVQYMCVDLRKYCSHRYTSVRRMYRDYPVPELAAMVAERQLASIRRRLKRLPAELQYAPGGVGAIKAKEEFQSLLS
jgi:hypothetical protein